MFLGIDHGTTAIRFAADNGRCWELSRREASLLSEEEILSKVSQNLALECVDLVALTYSMGDGLTRIMRLEDAPNRGLLQQDGAGLHVGGGTRVYEAIRRSGWPAILLPGIHRASDIDSRLKVFSHGMSPEKVGLAYWVLRSGVDSFIISDCQLKYGDICRSQWKNRGRSGCTHLCARPNARTFGCGGHKEYRCRPNDG